jgi:hypothetical protein
MLWKRERERERVEKVRARKDDEKREMSEKSVKQKKEDEHHGYPMISSI